jgi:hypothetical protein
MFRKIACHTSVNYHQMCACVFRHYAYSSSARKEIQDHLSGYFLRIASHALRYHAVISSRHNYSLAFDARPLLSEYPRKLYRDTFEPSKTAGRFREIVLSSSRKPH